MDWDANLAAIIKHTDANLEQQFRRFVDVTTEMSSSYLPSTPNQHRPAGPTMPMYGVTQSQQQDAANFATAFLRETMASSTRPPNLYTSPASVQPVSFAQHFRQQQEKKRYYPASQEKQSTVNQCKDYNTDWEQSGDSADRPTRRRRSSDNNNSHSTNVGSGIGYQMFTSPTYDMAQMMEQVRLSLKLEVDARAAIAERQLSALLGLCKSTSDELDRLRIDVCANDRQLHTIDQIQAKLRQELTTQKDIGYHLQSMCGKDESWRMQAENQLLELRQMVATIREQGNGLQVQIQDKLSRQELLVQFNASIEPIKAQFQVTLQHQAQQLAEITRSSSSSTMLLDALTQKVNRMHSEEIVELRHELQALKVHVSRLGLVQVRDTKANAKGNAKAERDRYEEANEDEESDQDSASEHDRRKDKKRRESQRQEDRQQIQLQLQQQLKQEVVEHVQHQVLMPWKHEWEQRLLTSVSALERELSTYKHEMNAMTRHMQDNAGICERNHKSAIASISQRAEQMEKVLATHVRELRERQDQLTGQWAGQLEASTNLCQQTNEREMGKAIEMEQRERKQGLDLIYEEVRKTRHKLEEQAHEVTCENRSRATTLVDEMQQKMRKLDRKVTDAMEQREKDIVQECEGMINQVRLEIERKVDALITPIRAVEEEIKRMQGSGVGNLRVSVDKKPVDESNEQHKQKIASMESLLQQMMLQLKIQQQQLLQQPPTQPFSGGYWVPPLMVSPPPTPMAGTTSGAVPLTTPTTLSIPATPPQSYESGQMSSAVPMEAVNPSPPVVNEKSKSPPITTSDVPRARPLANSAGSTVSSIASIPPSMDLKIDDIIAHAMTDEFGTGGGTRSGSFTSRMNSMDVSAAESTPSGTSIPLPSSTPSVAPYSPAAAAKGAMVEAEMAKQRVEARRKQEMEARLQQQSSPSLTQAASASNLTSIVIPSISTCDSTEAGAAGSSPLHPARSSSMSNPSPSTLESTTSSTSNVDVAAQSHTKSAPTLPQCLLQSPQRPPPKSPLIPRSVVSSATELKLPPSPSPPTSSPPAPVSAARAEGKTAEFVPPPSPSSASAATAPATHVLCEQCRLPVRSDLLTDHMQRQCIKRTIPCPTCNTKYSWHEIDAHERECSNSSNHKIATGPPQLRKCRHCTADVPSIELFEHELHCDQMLKQCPHCLRRQKVSELQEHIDNCDCRLVPCPHECGGKFLQRGIAKHVETRCPKRPLSSATGTVPSTTIVNNATNPTMVTATSTLPASSVPDSANSNSDRARFTLPQEKMECKFCDEEFSAMEIETHENNCDWKPKRCQHCNMVIIARDVARHETSCKSSTKPCPHCQENLPLATLTTHASRCSKRPIKCIRCCQHFPADSIVTHSSSCKFVPTAQSGSPAPPPSSATSTSTPIKVPPPPPYPPTSVSSTPSGRPPAPPPSETITASTMQPPHPIQSAIPTRSNSLPTTASSLSTEIDERLVRRSLALSQLTNPTTAVPISVATMSARPSTSSLVLGGTRPNASPMRPEQDEEEDEDHEIDAEEEEDDEDEDEEEDDEEHMSLAQVVAEWSVENVCLWLHEDVGVPEVVPRFQQRQCRGDMLLELTESDLINDYGVKNRMQRERILSAIDAIKTSDEYSDEEEGEEEEAEEEEDNEIRRLVPAKSVPLTPVAPIGQQAPPSLVRHNSQPMLSPSLGVNPPSSLQSSSAMLRRINSALNVEFPTGSPSSTSALTTRSTKR